MRALRREQTNRRQCERPNGTVREVSKDAPRPRFAALARRTGTTHLRQRLRAGMEAVGRPSENDPERVPPDAVAKGSAGTDWTAHGGFLFRCRRGAAARVCATAIQITPLGRIRYSHSDSEAYRANGTSRSITNSNLAWALRRASSTAAAVSPLAKMNPR